MLCVCLGAELVKADKKALVVDRTIIHKTERSSLGTVLTVCGRKVRSQVTALRARVGSSSCVGR